MATDDKTRNFMAIRDLRPGMKNVTCVFIVIDKGSTNHTKDGSIVRKCRVADPTGSVCFSLWNEQAEAIEPGDILRLTKGYASLWKGGMVLYSGKYGILEKIGEFTMTFSETPDMSDTSHDFAIQASQQQQSRGQSNSVGGARGGVNSGNGRMGIGPAINGNRNGNNHMAASRPLNGSLQLLKNPAAMSAPLKIIAHSDRGSSPQHLYHPHGSNMGGQSHPPSDPRLRVNFESSLPPEQYHSFDNSMSSGGRNSGDDPRSKQPPEQTSGRYHPYQRPPANHHPPPASGGRR